MSSYRSKTRCKIPRMSAESKHSHSKNRGGERHEKQGCNDVGLKHRRRNRSGSESHSVMSAPKDCLKAMAWPIATYMDSLFGWICSWPSPFLGILHSWNLRGPNEVSTESLGCTHHLLWGCCMPSDPAQITRLLRPSFEF